jgi:hypothetical protein
VTGEGPDLRAGEAARWTPLAGGVSSDLWRVDLPGRSPLTFPPDSAMTDPAFDPGAFDSEQRADSPGIADLMEPDGMHTTPTVDYGTVLQGEIVLELDDGHRIHLAGDIVIQKGTCYGWRNQRPTGHAH